MESNQVQTLLAVWQDKIPQESTYMLQNELANLSQDKANRLNLIPFKSKIVGLVLGIFLGGFGADRFYKGDTLLGIIKLVLVIGGVI